MEPTKEGAGKIIANKEPKWYVLYTYPRAEKVVRKWLTERNIENFLPVILEQNKKGKNLPPIEKPLFNSYIFIHVVAYSNIYWDILNSGKVCRIIGFNNKPAEVRPKEIEFIRKLVTKKNKFVVLQNPDLLVNDKVMIVNGPFKKYEGYLVSYKSREKIMIAVESIGYSVILDVDINNVIKVPESKVIT